MKPLQNPSSNYSPANSKPENKTHPKNITAGVLGRTIPQLTESSDCTRSLPLNVYSSLHRKRAGLWSVSRTKSTENLCLVFQPENKTPEKRQWLASSHACVFSKSQLLWQQQLRRWRIVKTLEIPSHMSLNNIKFSITISVWEAFERHFVLFRLK